MSDTSRAIIVGAGIIGLATAFRLLEAGRAVTVIDRRGIAEEASKANAGALAFSDILPLATRGMLRKVPGWLADPLGPLAIRPAYLPRITPWLIRFWRAGRPDQVVHSIAAQASLMALARSEWASLAGGAGIAGMIRSDGALELYDTEESFKAGLPGWAAREKYGVAHEHVRGARLAELQPGLSPRFRVGTFVPGWQSVSDPYLFARALAEAVKARGGEIVLADVAAIRPAGRGVTIACTDGGVFEAHTVVVAAGAWSRALAAPLGDAVPLDTERGYNTTLPPGAFDLRRQLTFPDHGFVVANLETGIRVGGAVELGGLQLPPDFARAEAMLKKAKTFLPGLSTEGGTQWMGFRPSMPDSLPVIGPSRASPRIVHAFGHGHLGLTQAAATARIVTDLVTGREPPIDIAPFRADRY